MQSELVWLELAECLGARSRFFRPLYDAFGSPEAIFAASEKEILAAVPDIGEGVLKAILERRKKACAEKISFFCHNDGTVAIYPFDHPQYPAALREIGDPPVLLYGKGEMPDLSASAKVAVVGPREIDEYAKEVSYTLSFELAAAGAVIVSGFARGVDALATAAAIAAGGKTVSFLGCGIDRLYPTGHTKLRAECAQNGILLTEYAPGTPPNAQNFPARNRLISAVCDAVLVPAASATSGSLITARYAILYGKELFVVPGDITKARSVGTNRLLQVGARAALSAHDVFNYLLPLYRHSLSSEALRDAEQYATLTPEMLERFGLAGGKEKTARGEKKKRAQKEEKTEESIAPARMSKEELEHELSYLTPHERELYARIPDGAFTPDTLVESGMSIAEAMGTLTLFEVYGLLGSLPGGFYQKK